MKGHETPRSIPSLLAPSRPQKSPSPRLTPRRSSGGGGGGGSRRSSSEAGRFSLGRLPLLMGGGGVGASSTSANNENESEFSFFRLFGR